ncbi:hypothetical protein AURDEDRAFT_174969 [Auricularia subglabra TFB-10046 SS5]|uniref:Uncharacterized protein n=1 Tax=Auricularia subglabra (strain TFB-10046 / SS5) TaxID=717982 RepID=J0WSC5_AURST|nr:hypothetical protein AURDEDRAFT_174969 [Auricularia subglabra TFB-10046 SS5]
MFAEPKALTDEVARLDWEIQCLTCHINERADLRHELFELRKRIVKLGLLAYLNAGVKRELQQLAQRIREANVPHPYQPVYY